MISSDLEHKIKDSGRRFIPLISNAAKIEKTSPSTEVRLSQVDAIAAIPTGLPIVSSITDYVARQYIGNLGKIESGIVSVKAYGIGGQ
ncbi:MAG: hypothetical protein HC936_09930 [Leptolyngbyaceae cyanobacterium SU_3_3]|nr:hypothetical protein [Leptolyngbyaceae cyanobacterium SU_3_3]